MISCKELARAVAEGRLEEAGFWERLGLRFHLWICPPCGEYRRQVEAVGAALRARCAEGEPCDEELDRIERRIVEKLQAGGE